MTKALQALHDQYATLTAGRRTRAAQFDPGAQGGSGRPVSCATCGPAAPRGLYDVGSGLALARCKTCGLVFLDRLANAASGRFYVDVADRLDPRAIREAFARRVNPAMFERHRTVFESAFEEIFAMLNTARPKIARLLDIGCGHGFFLAHVAARGVAVQGLEIDSEVAGYARERFGLAVSEAPIESFSAKTQFDGIVMCDVLQHLADPKSAIERCADLLVPGGILFLQVPNLVGFRLPMGHDWGLPHHIWQFGPRTLSRLVEAGGLKPEAWSTGVLDMVEIYERGGPTWLDRIIWAAARRLKLGNQLMMIARKPDEAGPA